MSFRNSRKYSCHATGMRLIVPASTTITPRKASFRTDLRWGSSSPGASPTLFWLRPAMRILILPGLSKRQSVGWSGNSASPPFQFIS